MPAFACVIFGALFTLAAAYSLGRAAIWKWNSPASVTLAIGAAALSFLIFFLRLAGFAWPHYLFALGVACLVPLAWRRLGTIAIPRWGVATAAILTGYGFFYAVHALAPEFSQTLTCII